MTYHNRYASRVPLLPPSSGRNNHQCIVGPSLSDPTDIRNRIIQPTPQSEEFKNTTTPTKTSRLQFSTLLYNMEEDTHPPGNRQTTWNRVDQSFSTCIACIQVRLGKGSWVRILCCRANNLYRRPMTSLRHLQLITFQFDDKNHQVTNIRSYNPYPSEYTPEPISPHHHHHHHRTKTLTTISPNNPNPQLPFTRLISSLSNIPQKKTTLMVSFTIKSRYSSLH